MRVALARALFIQPEFLLLDERKSVRCIFMIVPVVLYIITSTDR